MTPNEPTKATLPLRLDVSIDPEALARINATMTALVDAFGTIHQQMEATARTLETTLGVAARNDPTTPPATSSVPPARGVTNNPPHDPTTRVTPQGHHDPNTTPHRDTHDPDTTPPEGSPGNPSTTPKPGHP